MTATRFLTIASALAVVLGPTLASAQNTTAGTAFRLLVGQSPVRFSLTAATTERWFDFQSRAGRSYCIEVSNTDDGSGGSLVQADPTVAVYSDAAGTASIGANNDIETEPDGAFQSRVCFISTAAHDGRIKVTDATAGTAYYYIRIVESTLWSSWFFQGGDYNSFVLARNTTDGTCHAKITWRTSSGVVAGATDTLTVAAHAGIGTNSKSFVPTAINGTVEIAHDCSPEALVGQMTSLSASTGLGFDSPLLQRRPW
jgi:hypothetical protein